MNKKKTITKNKKKTITKRKIKDDTQIVRIDCFPYAYLSIQFSPKKKSIFIFAQEKIGGPGFQIWPQPEPSPEDEEDNE